MDETFAFFAISLIFNFYPFTDKRMAGNLHPFPNNRTLLYFDKRSDPGFIVYLTSIQVNESVDGNILSQYDIRGNSAILVHLQDDRRVCGIFNTTDSIVFVYE